MNKKFSYLKTNMGESLEIGFFTDSYFPEVDGVTYTLDSWKNRLEERGHTVHIVYPNSEEYDSGENEIPVSSISNPFYEGYKIPIPVSRPDYPELDVVHCHSPAFLGISGLRYSKKNNLPSVYTHHTPIEEYFEQSIKSSILAGFLKKLYVPFEQWLLRRFDVLTSSTEEPRRDKDFRNLPVGIDTEFFRPREKNFFSSKKLKEPVIGYSGRISMEKNPSELLQMAEEFEGTLVMVGEGPHREKIDSEKPPNVLTMDFLDRGDLPVFYSSIDVFVTASTGDTLGLSTLEANACGTPVVAPEVVPFNKTIKQENGILYEKDDQEDFSEKIQVALQDDFRTRDAVEKYSLSSTINRLEEIYYELNQKGR